MVGGGALTVGFRLTDVGGWTSRSVLAFGSLALATAVSEQFQIALVHRRETQNFALTDAVWTAGLILAGSSELALAVAAGVIVGESAKRWVPHKIVFNAAQFVLGVTAAEAVYKAVGSGPAREPATWGAVALGMATFFAVNTVALGLMIALAERKRLWTVLRQPLNFDLLHWTGNVTLGILAAVLWQTKAAAVPLLVVPLAMLYSAYRGWFQSLRQRDLMNEIARTADAIAEHGDLSQRIDEGSGIDEVGALARTLNRMVDRLETAFRRERRFFVEASHELRTPVTICRGHLEVLGSDPPARELRETVELVLDELDLMGRILQDMTTLASAEQADFVERQPVVADRFVRDLAAKAAPLLDGRMRVELPPDRATLDADPQRLTQALINLLENAARHGKGNGPVDLRLVPEDGYWRFEVADVGGGLPPGDEDRLFRPFSQGPESPGSGLGLAIVRRIAEAHDGAAGVDNRPGEGATFWIRLPR
ncbi:MAG TPA: ATP-binding protein [Gaiellaceae bacterium]|nr:ATP-binding protein [Gaiellaceae bacterium]